MEKFHKYIDIGFLLAILLIPFIYHFGRLDVIGPQYLFLSVLLFSYTIIKLSSKKKFQFKSNYSISFFLLFLLMALLSIFNSLNPTESIIELSKHFITFLFLVFTFSIFNSQRNYISSAILFLVGFLSDIKIMNSPRLRFIIQTLVVLGVIYFSSITVPQIKIIFFETR